jgi:hypothetical protein
MDVSGSNTSNGTAVQIWSCNGSGAQDWTARENLTLRAFGNPGKCLDIVSGGTSNGSRVQIWDCNGSGGQEWVPAANGALLNPQSGRCLDDPGLSTTDGTQLVIWDCNGGDNQRWTLSDQPVGVLKTVRMSNGGVVQLIASKDKPDNGTPVLAVSTGDTNLAPYWSKEEWTFRSDGTIGVFGKCLDVTGSGTANGTKVQLYDCNGSGAQQWTYTTNHSLRNPNSGRCLDDPNSVANPISSGTQVQIWDCNGTGAQHWILS